MKNKKVEFILTQAVIDEVKELIIEYKKQVTMGNIDYYELFKISPSQTAETIKNSVDLQRLNFFLRADLAPVYGLDAVGQANYRSLVRAFADFKNGVLNNENSKKKYDEELAAFKRAGELKETQADFAYVPELKTVDTSIELPAAYKALFALAEKSIKLQGTSKTVMLLANLLVDKSATAVPVELKDDVDRLPMKVIDNILVKKHGKKGIVTIVCEELDELFSRKTTILTEALALTADKHNPTQPQLALKILMEHGTPLGFTRYKDTTKGRDKVTMEIKQDFVKYVIAAYMATDKDLRAMDKPSDMANMYKTDDELNEIVSRMVPTKKKLFGGFGK